MTDHPILYSAPMIRAKLAGLKTQTRRILSRNNTLFNGGRWPAKLEFDDFYWDQAWIDDGPSPAGNAGPYLKVRWPYYCVDENAVTDETLIARIYPKIQFGDRLWVRESYYQRGCWEKIENDFTKIGKQKWRFTEDGEAQFDEPEHYRFSIYNADPEMILCYKRLGRFMPRKYSRMTDVVTDVRVQRLQDISEEDAIAEGIHFIPDSSFHGWTYNGCQDVFDSPVLAYEHLWESINGPGSWALNPWVVAYTTEQHICNIQEMK